LTCQTFFYIKNGCNLIVKIATWKKAWFFKRKIAFSKKCYQDSWWFQMRANHLESCGTFQNFLQRTMLTGFYSNIIHLSDGNSCIWRNLWLMNFFSRLLMWKKMASHKKFVVWPLRLSVKIFKEEISVASL